MNIKRTILTLSILLTLPLATWAMERTELLPDNAQNYVRISDTTRFLSQFKASSVGKLWADSQFQDFLGNPDAEIWKALFFEDESEAEAELNMKQMKLAKGEVVIAFNMEEEFFLILAMDEAGYQRNQELDIKLNELSDHSRNIIKDSFQDVEITRHIENSEAPDEESHWEAHFKNTLLVGSTREWIEKCIVQLRKETPVEPTGNPTLSMKLALSSLIRDGVLVGMKESLAEDQEPPTYDPEVLFDALGLMGIENFFFKLELKDTEMVADSTLRVTDLTKGLFTLFDVRPSELPTVTFIPEDIASLEVGRFNLLRFWQEIPNVLATAMPSVKPQFDMVMAMVQQQVGIDLEQDLLAHLGTKYLSFSTTEDDQQISVIAVDLKDGAAFKTGLETTMASPMLQAQIATVLNTETFLDHTIYTITDEDPNEELAFSVKGDYLLYGHPAGLRQVIRTQNSDAAANTSFEQSTLVKGLRKHVPSHAFGYSAIDWKKNMDVLVRELSKPEYISIVQQKWAASGSPLPPPDFSKLPTSDHIASFFNVSYQYAEATDEGIHQKIILKY